MKTIKYIVILIVLLVFNPRIDTHKEALRPYAEKALNEYYQNGNFVDKLSILVLKDAYVTTTIDSLHRKSYGVFSLGYINDKLVTLGILNYVHVFE